jgi:glycosyltransferase involved in cell wall biosynthesis
MTSAARALRVLHLRDSPWVDGPGRTILETGVHADKERLEFHIGAFAPPGASAHPLVDAARAAGIHGHLIPDAGLNRTLVANTLALVREVDADVLHSSELRSRLLALACRRARPGLRLVTTTHGWIANDFRRRMLRLADKALLRQFDHVILVSNAMRKLVPRWWLPDARVSVMHNALVLGRYGQDVVNATRRTPEPRGRVVLLNAGRLSAEKGQDLLLRAVAALAGEYPGLELHFAGIGPLESALRELAQSLGIAQRVYFLGYVADMPSLYRDVDLVVQSSLTEGLPNVILEAAYLRVPIVATDVGGTGEVIEHGRGGYLIAPGSVAELVSGIRGFLEDPARFVRMGENARDNIRGHFAFDVRTERLTRLYETLCASRAAPA